MSVEDDAIHRDRARAEAFGAIAADYDRFRPGYPDALLDDLMALHPTRVLDIGCGTGKVARSLAARGALVLGVEIDLGMAAVARGHGLDVEVGSFEEWDDRGRRFDLIVSGQAWHWLDPYTAAPKAARLLLRGGTMVLFWNYDEPEPETRAVIDAVYNRLAPELAGSAITAHLLTDRPYVEALQATGAFADLATQTYEWRRTLSVADWIGRTGTHSDHLLLGKDRLAALLAELESALREHGETVTVTGGTYVIWARP
jgi:SAM-dependent methyltransferase